MRLAIPTETADGLESLRSGHFGRAPFFTIVTIENDAVAGVESVPNVDHDEQGCMGIVAHALKQDIDAMLVAGMGGRPLSIFAQNGVAVYFERETPQTGAAVDRFLRGECLPMTDLDVCQH